MVIGDRETGQHRALLARQEVAPALGSAVVRRASGTGVPDTTSGFRAYNREAALQLQVVSKFTYTLESLIQAGKMLVAVDHVPVRTNPKTRESRLFPSTWSYVRRNGVSIFRIYALYEPLRVFMMAAAVVGARRRGHLGALRLLLRRTARAGPRPVADPRAPRCSSSPCSSPRSAWSATSWPAAACSSSASSSGSAAMELQLGVEPSHYEPGAKPTGQDPTTGAQAGDAHGQDRGAGGRLSCERRTRQRDAAARSPPATPSTSTAPPTRWSSG